MQHYNFIATNNNINFDSISVEDFVESFPDFQTVALSNDKELELLLALVGIKNATPKNTSNSSFTKYWDLTNFSLPAISEAEFDKLFSSWLEITNKEKSMNEYGNLIFLAGKSDAWNKLKYKYVVKEEKYI